MVKLLFWLYIWHKVNHLPLKDHFSLILLIFALVTLTMCLCWNLIIRIFDCFFHLAIIDILLVFTLLCRNDSIFCGSCAGVLISLLIRLPLVYVSVTIFLLSILGFLRNFMSILLLSSNFRIITWIILLCCLIFIFVQSQHSGLCKPLLIRYFNQVVLRTVFQAFCFRFQD